MEIVFNDIKVNVRELSYEEVLTNVGKNVFVYCDHKDSSWPEGYYLGEIKKPGHAESEADKTVGKVTYRDKSLTGYANIWPDKEHTRVFIVVNEGA